MFCLRQWDNQVMDSSSLHRSPDLGHVRYHYKSLKPLWDDVYTLFSLCEASNELLYSEDSFLCWEYSLFKGLFIRPRVGL